MDLLSSLPVDILHHLCRFVLKSQTDVAVDRHSQISLSQPAVDHPSIVFSQALRSSCKLFKFACDDLRTSIAFTSEEQAAVEPYLQKLSSVKSLTITYNSHSLDIHRSLPSLKTILPELTTIKVKYEFDNNCHGASVYDRILIQDVGDTLHMNSKPVAAMGALLLPWSKTLQHLELTNFSCISTAGAGSRGMSFLSKMSRLQILKLNSVFPSIEVEDISGCTGLLSLALLCCPRKGSTSLDLSSFTLLQELDCRDYNVVQLKLARLDKLQVLICEDNSISVLDLAGCTALTQLNCGECGVQALDLSSCSRLQRFQCHQGTLSSLCLMGCKLLTELCFDGNASLSTELDLSSCALLQSFKCRSMKFANLDLSACPNLEVFDVINAASLVTINFSGLRRLTKIGLDGSYSVILINLAGCTALTLNCSKCIALTTLQLTKCSSLQALDVRGCALQSLDLSHCERLCQLDCRQCPLKRLDLSACVCLGVLLCGGTDIKRLDVSSAAATLTKLSCDRSPLLEVLLCTDCSVLTTLWCGMNPLLRELNFKGCWRLTEFWCRGSGRFDGETLASLRAAEVFATML